MGIGEVDRGASEPEGGALSPLFCFRCCRCCCCCVFAALLLGVLAAADDAPVVPLGLISIGLKSREEFFFEKGARVFPQRSFLSRLPSKGRKNEKRRNNEKKRTLLSTSVREEHLRGSGAASSPPSSSQSLTSASAAAAPR